MSRIAAIDIKKQDSKRKLHWFLARRCNRDFLSQYITRNPQFISALRVFSYLWAVSDVEVIARLHEFGLLPELKRIEVVAQIREMAVNTPDSGFLQKRFRHIFTRDEVVNILEHVRTTLLPNLDDYIDDWRSDYNGDDDPEEYFDDLKSTLKDYLNEFADLEDAQAQIDTALDRIDEVIEDLRSEQPEEPDYDDYYGRGSSGSGSGGNRSIFDDVDL